MCGPPPSPPALEPCARSAAPRPGATTAAAAHCPHFAAKPRPTRLGLDAPRSPPGGEGDQEEHQPERAVRDRLPGNPHTHTHTHWPFRARC